jgi:acetolactate synthase-1/2/3 large subunit
LDFRLGYGLFGPDGQHAPVVHLVDSPGEVAAHVPTLAAGVGAELALTFDAILTGWTGLVRIPDIAPWAQRLRDIDRAARADDAGLLGSDSDPIHPARVYGELLPRLTDDTVVIGDGGDFVSFAGRFVEPAQPGRWLDPGPYGCLGSGLGYAMAARIAHPQSPVVLLLGDGAAGFSLMDVDTLVRHGLPVVMVMGNNAAWGLEKHPMRFLHGYDVIADLNPQARYCDVVTALGGGGERVTAPGEIGPAIDRAMAAGIPYVVNVMTDPDAMYPRSTSGI